VYSVLYNQSQHYILALVGRANKQESQSKGMIVRFFMSLKILKVVEPVFFSNTKFHLLTWKIWFRPIKKIFRGKNDQIPQIWQKRNPKFQILKISSKVAKDIECFCFFSTYISSMQSNLNKLSYGYHQVFSYITELKKRKVAHNPKSTIKFSHLVP